MKYVRLATRLSTCVMVVALWGVGLWILLPLAKGMHESGMVLLGLTLLTLVHGGLMLTDMVSKKRAHHQKRLMESPGSSEQAEAHLRDAIRMNRFEAIGLVATLVCVVGLIIFRLIIL